MSDIVMNTSIYPVNDIEIINMGKSMSSRSHVFVSIEFLDINKNTIKPTSGQFSMTVLPIGMKDYQPFPNSISVDASKEIQQLSYAANAISLKYMPTNIIGAHSIRITIIANEN